MKIELNNEYKLKENKILVNVKDKNNNIKQVSYDPYLYGAVFNLAKKRLKNWHGLILITGGVGDGKSSLGDGICGLDKYFFNSIYSINNIVFSTTDFESFCDDLNNFYQPIKYDEAIEGATNQDMARSSKGLSFKKKIVQKRKKKHLYVMCIDELEEYAWKLIKMADIWIDVKVYNMTRGYFDIYTDKQKIKSKYLALKNKQYYIANKIYPDKKNCKFMNYEDIFIDEEEYQKKKDKETISEDKKKEEDKLKKRDDSIMRALNSGLTQQQTANIFGLSKSTIRDTKAKRGSNI